MPWKSSIVVAIALSISASAVLCLLIVAAQPPAACGTAVVAELGCYDRAPGDDPGNYKQWSRPSGRRSFWAVLTRWARNGYDEIEDFEKTELRGGVR